MDKQIRDFTDLEVWNESHQFVLKIYKLSSNFPQEEKYGLTSQIRRAGVSIPLNIAEGYGRYHYKDKNKFFYQARGSLKEVQSLLLIAKDLKYLSKESVEQVWCQAKTVERLINGIIRFISSRS